MAGGRPPKYRVPCSGEKLLAALRMAGLAWSSANVQADNHVLNNKRWLKCGLPRSATTIANDIRLGLPVDRVDKYASFLGVTIDTLTDASIDPYSPQFTLPVLENKPRLLAVSPLPLHTEDPSFCHNIRMYNSDDYNIIANKHLKGLFILYLLEASSRNILKTAIHLYSVESNHILLKGFLSAHNANIHIKGRLYRFGTFLHVNYISEDASILGYMMTHDPTAPAVAANRRPFQLPLYGLAGSLTSAEVPDRFLGIAEKLEELPGDSADERYLTLCRQIERAPLLTEDAPNYRDIHDKILLLMTCPGLFHVR